MRPQILVPVFVFFVLLFGGKDLAGWLVNHGDYTPFSVDELRGAGLPATSLPNSTFFELRDVRSSYPVLHSLVIGALAKITGSIETAWCLSRTLFPACIGLLFTLLACQALTSPIWSVFAASAPVLFAFGPRNLLLLGLEALLAPVEATRTPQPSPSYAVAVLTA